MNLTCPQCHKDDAIQKVSAVVAGGHVSGSFSGFSGGSVNIDGKWGSTNSYTTLGGTSATDLARTLASPPEPKKQFPGFSFPDCVGSLLAIPLVGSGFVLFIICLCLAQAIFSGSIAIGTPAQVTINGSTESTNTTGLIAGVAGVFLTFCFCLILFLLLSKESKKERDKKAKEIEARFVVEKSLWERAMVKWNRLYYCHRDGIVFDVENGEICQPTQIREFIYK